MTFCSTSSAAVRSVIAFRSIDDLKRLLAPFFSAHCYDTRESNHPRFERYYIFRLDRGAYRSASDWLQNETAACPHAPRESKHRYSAMPRHNLWR
jgi:hypothetical protein